MALAIVGALNAAISAGYYLRIIGVMYFRPTIARAEGQGGIGAAWAVFACAVLVLGIGCYPGPWLEQAAEAARALRYTAKVSAAVERPLAVAPKSRELPSASR